jgi:NAD(P)H dehydrogenase (quinone)
MALIEALARRLQQDFADGAFDLVTGDLEKLAGRPPQDLREILVASLK